MKNSEIYEVFPFPQKEICELISFRLKEIFELECNNQKVKVPFDREDPILWNIKDTEEIIKFEKEKLKLLKEKYALVIIASERGWKEFDVSEYTRLSNGEKHWISFWGTEDEHKILLKNIQ